VVARGNGPNFAGKEKEVGLDIEEEKGLTLDNSRLLWIV